MQVFQSSPSLLAGCNHPTSRCQFLKLLFQSSPSLLAGCNHGLTWCTTSNQFGFQSSPSLLAGCNRYSRPFFDSPRKFQSSPSLLAGCNNTWLMQWVQVSVFQSSPSLLAGCNVDEYCGIPRSRSFNPHPACWLGATHMPMVIVFR